MVSCGLVVSDPVPLYSRPCSVLMSETLNVMAMLKSRLKLKLSPFFTSKPAPWQSIVYGCW